MKFPFLTEVVYDHSSYNNWSQDSEWREPKKLLPMYIKISILDKWDSKKEPYFTASKVERSLFGPNILLSDFNKFDIFYNIESDDVFLLQETISMQDGTYIGVDQEFVLLGNMYGTKFIFNGYKNSGPFFNLCDYLMDNFNESGLSYDLITKKMNKFIEQQVNMMVKEIDNYNND